MNELLNEPMVAHYRNKLKCSKTIMYHSAPGSRTTPAKLPALKAFSENTARNKNSLPR